MHTYIRSYKIDAKQFLCNHTISFSHVLSLSLVVSDTLMATDKYAQPLDIPSSTVLITGGSGGIGLGLARCFVQAGATVLITGRREQQLKEAAEELNKLGKKKVVYRVNDVEKVTDRLALYDWATSEHPEVNVLINNAGIQQRFPLLQSEDSSKIVPWEEREKEIQINVCAPMHLCDLFLQHFRRMKTTTALMNVSSGLAFVPLTTVAIYSSTKAALHSYTMSLRYQLADKLPNVQVYEIIPPAVRTNLGGSHDFGEPLNEYCEGTFARLVNGDKEVGYKQSDVLRMFKSREESDKGFIGLNEYFKKLAQDQKH